MFSCLLIINLHIMFHVSFVLLTLFFPYRLNLAHCCFNIHKIFLELILIKWHGFDALKLTG